MPTLAPSPHTLMQDARSVAFVVCPAEHLATAVLACGAGCWARSLRGGESGDEVHAKAALLAGCREAHGVSQQEASERRAVGEWRNCIALRALHREVGA